MRIFFLNFTFILSACSSTPSNEGASQRKHDREMVRKELSTENSLKPDGEILNEMRKDIPAEKQKSSDEIGSFLAQVQQGSEQPQVVREKFSMLIMKARESFHKKVQKLRESFRREETDRREDFFEMQKNKRTRFLSGKPGTDENHTFFARQDRGRQVFTSDERDRRLSFESELSAQVKDFDSYIKDKSDQFYEQFRIYSKKFSERPKEKNAVTGESNDFDKLQSLPSKTLGTED